MDKGNKRLIKTILVSGTSVLIGYLINFLMTPYITSNIGIDAYGFVSIARTSVTYVMIITTTLTTFVVRFVSVEYHKNNIIEANEYYSSSIAGCVITSLSILIVASLVIFKLENILNIPKHLIPSVKLLFFVVYINFVVTTITTPYSSAAYIKNRLDLIAYAKLGGHIADALILLLLFGLFTPTLWFVPIGTLTTALVLLSVSILMTKHLTPNLQYKKKYVSFNKAKEIIKTGIWTSLNSLGNVFNGGLDLLISNLMLTSIQTGQIAIAKSMGSMFTMLYQLIFQPFQPRLLKAYASGDKNVFIYELQKSMKVCGLFSNIVFAGFFVIGKLYFKLWLPEQDYTYLHILTVYTVLGAITAGVIQPIYYINTLTLTMKLPSLITILTGFFNVISMYFLLKYTNLGPIAVVITTVVVMLLMNLLFNPIYSARCVDISSKVIYSVLIRHLISAILMTVVFSGIALCLKPEGWIGLFINAVIMTLFGIVVHVLCVSNFYEIKIYIEKIRSIIKK